MHSEGQQLLYGLSRFSSASYCRCVGSEHLNNGKRKGRGHTKNGNKHLTMAGNRRISGAPRSQGPGVFPPRGAVPVP